MKRYRVIYMSFDTRARLLDLPIRDEWAEHVKESHRKSKRQLAEQFAIEFGEVGKEQKIQNILDLGPSEMSVLAYHNAFQDEIRRAFIVSSYYPALTGACSLGERILNHLVLGIRDYYKDTPEYRRVRDKESFANWHISINALSAWGVLLPNVAGDFRKLEEMRQGAVHFRREVNQQARQRALDAIKCLARITEVQFGAFGTQPWFIPIGWGEVFIRKAWESNPFIKEVYLPCCTLVGYKSSMGGTFPHLVAVDTESYEDREITDEEFIARRYPDRYGSVADVRFEVAAT